MRMQSYIAERGLVVLTLADVIGGELCALTRISTADEFGEEITGILVYVHDTHDPAVIVRRHGQIAAGVRAWRRWKIKGVA